jgi:hypothetical protein
MVADLLKEREIPTESLVGASTLAAPICLVFDYLEVLAFIAFRDL